MADSSSCKRIKMEIIRVECLASLPTDLLTMIFGKVASHSLEDIFHVKLTCKDFLQIAETNYVYERVSLDKFALGPLEWVTDAKPFLYRVRVVNSDNENVDGPDEDYLDPRRMYRINRQVYSLQRCRGSGNPKVLYREGVVNYFRESSGPDMQEKALENLKIAALKGHKDSQYVYCMLLLSGVDEDKRKLGFELFHALDNEHVVGQCRLRVKRFIRGLWVRRQVVYEGSPICKPNLCERRMIGNDVLKWEDDVVKQLSGKKRVNFAVLILRYICFV